MALAVMPAAGFVTQSIFFPRCPAAFIKIIDCQITLWILFNISGAGEKVIVDRVIGSAVGILPGCRLGAYPAQEIIGVGGGGDI